MQKIITLFQRNYDGDRLVRNEVTSGAEWVLNGEGNPLKKWDGTCCLMDVGRLYKRHTLKVGEGCERPKGWRRAQRYPDLLTREWPGWLLVKESNPEDKYHWEVYQTCSTLPGTYELVGPKINGNKEGLEKHTLIMHEANANILKDFLIPEYEYIKNYLKEKNEESYLEGIVWHHEDGRMVKIKYRDFFK